MTRVAILGAGGLVFPLRLIADLLAFPALHGLEVSLMDIELDRAERTARAARELAEHHGVPASFTPTTDRRAALAGADWVIVTFQVGGVEAYGHDVNIPRKYGLDQPVGDTLGPGGVFRFLRTAPALARIAADLREVAPRATVLNYANPMAMNCWLLDRLGTPVAGLCHSVQGTSRMLARAIGVPYEEVTFRTAGINHQAWFLEFRRGQQDLLPRLREAMREQHLPKRDLNGLALDADHSAADRADSVYEGGFERVRTEIMDAFGYFHTESSHHASEYTPWFRKDEARILDFIPRRWDYYRGCVRDASDPVQKTVETLARLKADPTPSLEYGARIINAWAANEPVVVHANVPNRGLIANLPEGCCVEVPCLVDANGVQPTAVGKLPPQLAAVNRSNVNVQELAVEAAVTGDLEHALHAIALDPLTGALLTLDEIKRMTAELIEAHQPFLAELPIVREVAAGA